MTADIGDLRAFAALVRRDLKGAVNAKASGRASLDGREFEILVTGMARDLGVGQREVDLVLAGASEFTAEMSGNGDVLRLKSAVLAAPRLSARISGQESAESRAYDIEARLSDLGLFVDGISGALSVNGMVQQPIGGDIHLPITANWLLHHAIHRKRAIDPIHEQPQIRQSRLDVIRPCFRTFLPADPCAEPRRGKHRAL